MLDSPAGAGRLRRSLRAEGTDARRHVLLHGGQSWFVKMTGPADLVGQQQPAFEAFVKSLRFEAGDEVMSHDDRFRMSPTSPPRGRRANRAVPSGGLSRSPRR